MQVSAYDIVKAFGIEALGKFYSLDNAEEIQRVREEWHSLAKDEVIIKSFNDGNNIFEVVFNLTTFECWRTDHPETILEPMSFIDEKVQALNERERIEKLFSIESDRVMTFLKSTLSSN